MNEQMSTRTGRAWRRYPLLRCLALYRFAPGLFLLTAGLFGVGSALLAWQQWLVGRAVHDVTRGAAARRLADGGVDLALAWRWLAVLLAVALARAVLQYLVTLASQRGNQHLLTTLRARIFQQVQALDLAYHWRHGVGELVTRTTRDVDKVRDAMITFWRQGVDALLTVVAAIGLLCWYHPLLGLVPLALTAAGVTLLARQAGHLVRLDRAAGAAYERVNQELAEGIHGVRVIKSFVQEAARIAHFSRQVADFAAQTRQALGYASARIPLPQAIVALGHVWIMAYGALLVACGALDLGQLSAALLVATMLVFRLEGVGRALQAWAEAGSSAASIWALLDARPAIAGGAGTLAPGALGARLERVRLDAPGGGRAILDDCSLTLHPGETLALVGATGSGKSSLANLLARLLQADGGSVALGSDRHGWQDVRTLAPQQVRARVHVVAQESFLFSGTLADNLRLARPGASDADLVDALRRAGAADVLAGLDDGLATPLGERGVTLSGGQRQRLCLARALLAGPDLLVLDDATSALDALTERAVLGALRGQAHPDAMPTTLLLVASKLSTVLFADRVLLLRNGRIAAAGSHVQLAASDADYRELLGLDHD